MLSEETGKRTGHSDFQITALRVFNESLRSIVLVLVAIRIY